MAKQHPNRGSDRSERLEAEVRHLRAQLAELNGEAERREQEVLFDLLAAVRRGAAEIPTTSPWRETLLLLGFKLATAIPGVHTTVEEFAATARRGNSPERY